MRRTPLVAALAAVLTAMTAVPAAAHARLVSAEPAVNAIVDQAPATIVLTFSEPVETEFGQVQVAGPDGQRLDEAPPTTDGPEVQVPVAAAPDPGLHTVAYRVISADGHPVEGSFTYEVTTTGVAVDAATEDAVATEAAAPTPTQSPDEQVPQETPTALARDDSAVSDEVEQGGGMLLPVAVVALLVLGVGGALVARRRDSDDPGAV